MRPASAESESLDQRPIKDNREAARLRISGLEAVGRRLTLNRVVDHYGSTWRAYLPDFVVLVDDGRSNEDPVHLIVEIKGFLREDAKDKKATMQTYWIPGVNHLGSFGRWAFAEFTDVYKIESEFKRVVNSVYR